VFTNAACSSTLEYLCAALRCFRRVIRSGCCSSSYFCSASPADSYMKAKDAVEEKKVLMYVL
jgi:hypothetical protein